MNPLLSSQWLRAAAAALLGLAPLAALADDPAAGASLYTTHCASCHGASPLTVNSNKIYYGRNARAVIDSSITSVGQMNSLRTAFPAGGTALANVAAYLGNTPTSLAFASTAVGSTTATKTVTVYASLRTGRSISGLTVASTGDFARSGGTCGTTVNVGSSCTIFVAFTPTAAGTRSGTLSITHSNTLTPVAIALSGTGTASTSPVASISSSALTLPATTVGSTSATQTLTLSNTGTAPLSLTSLALSGTNPGDFALASGGTCAAGGSVAASSSCTVLVSFAPAAAGARSATLSINHNAANSPTTVALSGTGNAAPAAAISINATALNFGSQVVGTAGATQMVTVSNSGSAALAFTGLTLGGTAPGDFSRAGTCSTTTPVAAGGSCTLVLGFAPTATGSRSGTLTLASNASNGSAAVSLGGTGTATPVPAVGLSASSIAFGNQMVGTSSSANAITLTNSGSAALAISGITSSSSEFGLSHTCPASLAAGGTCTLSTVFTPASTGAKAGTLTLTSNAATSPNTVALSGTGAALVLTPVLAWTPATTALDFGSATVGAASATQTLTLTNSGSAVANLTAISVSGAAAADFALGQGSCAAGGTLAVGGTCTVVLGFTPTAAGARSASLAVASNGTAPSTVALGGTGTAAPVAAISVAPSAIGFSAVSGVVADVQTLTVQNTGTAVLQVSQLAIGSGGFTVAAASANGCAATPFSLAPGASCALSVAWTSATNASEIGSVVVTSNAPGAASTSVALSGTHTAAPAPGGGTTSNTGGGGCSLARGESPTDPVLWLLVVLAGGVLWRRRAP